ncbi:MAG: hypothetical protein M1839_003178 [Geoglossum umbratile]|nr:MAG: hypothetical protein M1839_003178 [Geoglossum umbratile]
MALPRVANLERAKWRTRCRQRLSEHIQGKLGISIEPSQVRLITGIDDPYNWSFLPEKRHLFSKHLSKHSTSAYMQLCREVGTSFEAVNADTSAGHIAQVKQGDASLSQPDTSFAAKIEQLEAENSRLTSELNQWRDQAIKESESKRYAQKEVDELQSTLQTARAEIQQMRHEINNWALTADFFKKSTIQSYRGLNEEFLLLEKLKSEVPALCNGQSLDWISSEVANGMMP